MNILMLAPLPPPSGGIASWTVRFKEQCIGTRIDLKLVNISMIGERASTETLRKNFVDEFRRTRRIICDLRKKIKSYRPDVVHINTSCSRLGVMRDALCMYISKKRAKVVVHCRCNIEDQLNGNISKIAFKYLVKNANKVIVLNRFSKKYVDNICTDKAEFIPNFIDKESIVNQHVIKDKIESIVTVGHIERSKGLIEIIETAKKNPIVKFILIGAIREKISKLNIPSNVVITGRLEATEVSSWLEKADVFLLPTKTEGFSNAILEAMAKGLPIITSDVGANFEMLEDKGGTVLKQCCSEKINDTLRILADPDIRKKMSDWNINKVKKFYQSDIVMSQFENLYMGIIQ